MSTTCYLSNVASDQSGWLVAYINERGPNAANATTVGMAATTTVSVVTTTTSLPMTLTNGGTSLARWLTYPFRTSVQIAAKPFVNVWASESVATVNAAVCFSIAQFTSTLALQAVFCSVSAGVELTTTMSPQAFRNTNMTNQTSFEAITATTIGAGDRLAIIAGLVSNASGDPKVAMAAGSVNMDYAGPTAGADGDSYLLFNETFNAGQIQFSSGSANPILGGPSVIALESIRQQVQPYVDAAFSNDIPWSELSLQLGYMEDGSTA